MNYYTDSRSIYLYLRKIIRYYLKMRITYTVRDKSMWTLLKSNDLFKFGPHNLSFFEKLEGLVC